jgi:hypothetical protein
MGALCLQWLRRISAEIVWIVSVSLGYGIMLVLARPAKVGLLASAAAAEALRGLGFAGRRC